MKVSMWHCDKGNRTPSLVRLSHCFLKAQYLQVTEGHVDSGIKYTIVNVYATVPRCVITFLWFIFWYGLFFLLPPLKPRDRPRGGISPLLYGGGGETPAGKSCSVSFSKHTAGLNGWSINFSGIDLHQFCLRAHTRSHFIVNQSFWKQLTQGPLPTNKPSIAAVLSGHKSTATKNICSISIAFPFCLSPSFTPVPSPPLVVFWWVVWRRGEERLRIFTSLT